MFSLHYFENEEPLTLRANLVRRYVDGHAMVEVQRNVSVVLDDGSRLWIDVGTQVWLQQCQNVE